MCKWTYHSFIHPFDDPSKILVENILEHEEISFRHSHTRDWVTKKDNCFTIICSGRESQRLDWTFRSHWLRPNCVRCGNTGRWRKNGCEYQMLITGVHVTSERTDEEQKYQGLGEPLVTISATTVARDCDVVVRTTNNPKGLGHQTPIVSVRTPESGYSDKWIMVYVWLTSSGTMFFTYKPQVIRATLHSGSTGLELRSHRNTSSSATQVRTRTFQLSILCGVVPTQPPIGRLDSNPGCNGECLPLLSPNESKTPVWCFTSVRLTGWPKVLYMKSFTRMGVGQIK